MPRAYFRSLELNSGHKFVIGIDEAGRGSLAGPLSVAAVLYDKRLSKLKGLNDSKLIAKPLRESLLNEIKNKFLWSHKFVPAKTIDEIGLTMALKQGFDFLVKDLESKIDSRIDLVLIDGKQKWALDRLSESIIGGDSKVRSIAAASIIAKVERDRYMVDLADKYSGYGFDQHVGYGTRRHRDAITKLGPCDIHRYSFAPISNINRK